MANRYVVTDASRENAQLIVHDDSVEVTIFIDHELSGAGGADASLIVGAVSGDTGDLVLSSGGASVLETQVTRIANVAGSTGTVTASNLQWTGGNLRVGHAGLGTLNIVDGASVSSTNVSIGHLTGSDGFARVEDGSEWTMSGDLLVGRAGGGSLIVAPGGSVTSANGSIGTESSGNGGVIVADGTWTSNGPITIGDSGTGGLSLVDAGSSVSNTDAYVGRSNGSLGVVSAREGAWSTTGRLSIGGDADTGVSGGLGIVEILGGTVTVENEIVIFPSGELTLDTGSLSSAIITVQPGGLVDWLAGTMRVDTFIGSLSNPGGVLATRPNSNSILVSGEYAQGPGGVLSLEIAGSAASNQYESVTVGNSAFLGGELRIEMADLFEPNANDAYTILDALNLGAGSFDNVASGERLTVESGLGSFLVHYGIGSPFDPSQVVLSDFQPAGLTGDYNDDGIVDAADYVVWRKTDSGNSQGYTDWQENFGEGMGAGGGSAGASPSQTGVPEPATLVLLMFAAAGWCLRRGRAA